MAHPRHRRRSLALQKKGAHSFLSFTEGKWYAVFALHEISLLLHECICHLPSRERIGLLGARDHPAFDLVAHLQHAPHRVCTLAYWPTCGR